MQKWGVVYWDNHSLVVNWMYVRSMLTLRILRYINTKSVDFVLYHTQAYVRPDIFMELPIGFGVKGCHPRERFVRLDKKLYVLKDAGMACFYKLKEGMEDRGFVQSHLYLFVWYR